MAILTGANGRQYDTDTGKFEDITNGDAWLRKKKDDYRELIKEYEGTEYYDYLWNNPYAPWKVPSFSPNLGQSILMSFGDTSGEDKYNADNLQRMHEWIANTVEQYRQQKYNSPSNQASLERQGGLNPDLTGISGVGSAAENDQPSYGSAPDMGHEEGLRSIQGFAGMCMQAYSFASGIAKDVLTLNDLSANIAGKDADTSSKILPLIEDFYKSRVGLPKFNKDTKQFEFPDLALDSLDSYANDHFQSRALRKKFISGVKNGFASAKHAFISRGIITDAEIARKSMSDSLGLNIGYGMDYSANEDSNPMIIVSTELGKAMKNIQKISLSEQYNTSKFHSDYYSKADGSGSAQAFNDTNKQVSEAYESSKSERKVEKVLNDSLETIISKLSSTASEGGLAGALSQGFLLYFSAMRANMIPQLPSIGFSRNKNGNFGLNSISM